jgi:hypothetical protein
MRLLKISTLFALTISACSTPKSSSEIAGTSVSFDKQKYFKEVILRKFRTVELPLTLRPPETGQSPTTNPQSADTLFFKSGYVSCFGLLPDTSKYYGLIWQGIADFSPPFLVTFTKQGELINEVGLYVGQCGGADCGWTCDETIQIDKHCRTFSIDTVTIWDCGDSLRTNLKKSIFYKSGLIDDKGKIIMSDTKEEILE